MNDAKLNGAILAQADLTGAELVRADLEGAKLAWADLTDCGMSGGGAPVGRGSTKRRAQQRQSGMGGSAPCQSLWCALFGRR